MGTALGIVQYLNPACKMLSQIQTGKSKEMYLFLERTKCLRKCVCFSTSFPTVIFDLKTFVPAPPPTRLIKNQQIQKIFFASSALTYTATRILESRPFCFFLATLFETPSLSLFKY